MSGLDYEDEVYWIGNHAYVPRLVTANIPLHRMPVSRYSTKKPHSLRSLGDDVYAPSGLALRSEHLAGADNPLALRREHLATQKTWSKESRWAVGAGSGADMEAPVVVEKVRR